MQCEGTQDFPYASLQKEEFDMTRPAAMPDPKEPDKVPDLPPLPPEPPIGEPEPDRLPDETPTPNPDEGDEPPMYV
jgi:hypothetical protein